MTMKFEEWKELMRQLWKELAEKRREGMTHSEIHNYESQLGTMSKNDPEYGQTYTITYNVTGNVDTTGWPTEIKSARTLKLNIPIPLGVTGSVDANVEHTYEDGILTINDVQQDIEITVVVSNEFVASISLDYFGSRPFEDFPVTVNAINIIDTTTNENVGQIVFPGDGHMDCNINPDHNYRFSLDYTGDPGNDCRINDLNTDGDIIRELNERTGDFLISEHDFIQYKTTYKFFIDITNNVWTIGRPSWSGGYYGKTIPYRDDHNNYLNTGEFLYNALYMNNYRKNASAEAGGTCYIYGDGTSYKIKNISDDTDVVFTTSNDPTDDFDIIVACGTGQIPNLGRRTTIDDDFSGKSLDEIEVSYWG